MNKVQLKIVAVVAALIGIADELWGSQILSSLPKETIDVIALAILGFLPWTFTGKS